MEQLCPLHSEIKMKKGNQPESSRGGCWQCDPAAGAGAHPAALEPPPPTPRTPDRGRRAGRLALPGFVSRARLAALWGHRVVVVNSAASGVDFFFPVTGADGKLIINTLQGQAGKPQTLKWWPGALQEWRAGPPGRSGKLCALCWRSLI